MNRVSGIVKAIAPAYSQLDAAQLTQLFVPRVKQLASNGSARQTRLGFVGIVGVMAAESSNATANDVRTLAANDAVDKILLYVNSPGGSVEGIDDLSETVSRAAKRKPVFAFVDFGCSAAYYAVCGATQIIVSRTATVGSIGTYILLADYSRALEQAGIDTYLIRSGPFKGAGTYGAKITTAELEQIQLYVNSLNRHFLAAVQRGRDMDARRLSEIADGRVWVGQEAVAIGLADRVAFFDDVLNELQPKPPQLLRGAAAYAEYNRLVDAETGNYKSKAIVQEAHAVVSAKHPQLAAEAEKYESVS